MVNAILAETLQQRIDVALIEYFRNISMNKKVYSLRRTYDPHYRMLMICEEIGNGYFGVRRFDGSRLS